MPDINEKLLQTLTNVDTKLTTLSTDLAKSFRGLIAESGETTSALGDMRMSVIETEDEIAGEIALRTKGKKLSEEEYKIQREIVQAKREEKKAIAAITEYQKQMKKAQGDEELLAKLTTQKVGAEQRLNDARSKQKLLMGNFGGSLAKTIGKFNLLGVAISWLTALLVGEYKRQKEIMKTTSGMIDLGDSFTDGRVKLERMSLAAGLQYDNAMKSITASRQAVNAMGGTANAFERWESLGRNFTAITGDIDEAFQMMLESEKQFRTQGVVPTTRAMQMYALDVQKLASMTGMASGELAALYNEVAMDTDSLTLLRAAREDEREAILASQRALINMNVAAGMTAEQAKDAAKMLNKMVAAKPLDRIKQAARIRALGGAMGIGGAEEAARAVMAGPRATAEQKRQLMEFSKSATNMVDQMRGAGLGQEIFAMTMLEKLDLEQYYGPGSSFSTTLASALKNQVKDFKNALNDSNLANMMEFQRDANRFWAATGGEGVGFLRTISEAITAIRDWMANSWLFGGGAKKALEKGAAKIREESPGVQAGGMGYIEGPPEIKKATEAVKKSAKGTVDVQKETSTIAADNRDYSMKTSIGIDNQLKSMNNTNEILMRIHSNSEKQVDLAEKQLTAMTLTDEEKKRDNYRRRLLEGNQFVSRYGYTP